MPLWYIVVYVQKHLYTEITFSKYIMNNIFYLFVRNAFFLIYFLFRYIADVRERS